MLAVAAACAEGTTTFADAAELKVKESDRIATVVAALQSIGARRRTPDRTASSSTVEPAAPWPADASNRLATTGWPWRWPWPRLAAATPIRIAGWDAVATSYPSFEEEYQRCVSQAV